MASILDFDIVVVDPVEGWKREREVATEAAIARAERYVAWRDAQRAKAAPPPPPKRWPVMHVEDGSKFTPVQHEASLAAFIEFLNRRLYPGLPEDAYTTASFLAIRLPRPRA